MDLRENLIRHYYALGLQQKEILFLMETVHSVRISPRNLKRILQNLQLYRRKHYSDLQEVYTFIREQVDKSGQLHGYRWMHLKCIQNGLCVPQSIVREILSIIDPQGVDLRRRKRLRRRQYSNKGPNSVWHVDSYDKLKPFGICINGAIDGYSRYIIWLRAGRTASDPKVIGGYYVNAIQNLGGCPETVRSDMGTENIVMERIQTALRQVFATHRIHKPAFMYGRSTSNQRIEAWWSILRKHNAQYWMNIFEILKDEGLFNGTFLDKSLIQFCFLEIIQNELDEIVLEWNTHKIQGKRNNRAPLGRPLIMYQAPNLYRAENLLTLVPETVTGIIKAECRYYDKPCDEDIYEMCNNIVLENNYNVTTNDPYDCVQLYVKLRLEVHKIIDAI